MDTYIYLFFLYMYCPLKHIVLLFCMKCALLISFSCFSSAPHDPGSGPKSAESRWRWSWRQDVLLLSAHECWEVFPFINHHPSVPQLRVAAERRTDALTSRSELLEYSFLYLSESYHQKVVTPFSLQECFACFECCISYCVLIPLYERIIAPGIRILSNLICFSVPVSLPLRRPDDWCWFGSEDASFM